MTAFADKHLQKFEQKKYMRNNKMDTAKAYFDLTLIQSLVIGDLLNQNMILLPFAINPHGHFRPILNHFLFQSSANLNYAFPNSRPNTIAMFPKLTKHPAQ